MGDRLTLIVRGSLVLRSCSALAFLALPVLMTLCTPLGIEGAYS